MEVQDPYLPFAGMIGNVDIYIFSVIFGWSRVDID